MLLTITPKTSNFSLSIFKALAWRIALLQTTLASYSLRYLPSTHLTCWISLKLVLITRNIQDSSFLPSNGLCGLQSLRQTAWMAFWIKKDNPSLLDYLRAFHSARSQAAIDVGGVGETVAAMVILFSISITQVSNGQPLLAKTYSTLIRLSNTNELSEWKKNFLRPPYL